MSDPLVSRVFQRWAEAVAPLQTTLDLKTEIDAMDTKIKSLEFQKKHATSLGRRNALVNAINALTRQRNALVARYKQITGRV